MSYERDLHNLMMSEFAWRVFRRHYRMKDTPYWGEYAIMSGDYRRFCEKIMFAQNYKAIKQGIRERIKGLFKFLRRKK